MAINILDLIERKTSVQTMHPEDIVGKVIAHQWKTAHEALYDYNSVEISGLGKYKTRTGVIKRRIDKNSSFIEYFQMRLSEDIDEKEFSRCSKIIEGLLEQIEYLKTKECSEE